MVSGIVLTMLLAVLSYGGYFWLANSIQQLTNDAARSALAGLVASERQSLAQSTIQAEVNNYGVLEASRISVAVAQQSAALTVSVSYDASGSIFWTMATLVPMPPTTIQRSATIMLGGY